MNPRALPRPGTGSRGFFLWAWDAIWRRLVGPRASETSVRQSLLQQAGIAAVEQVRVVPGPAGRRHLWVQIRVTDGCDAREVTRAATEALFRIPSVAEIHLLASGDETCIRGLER